MNVIFRITCVLALACFSYFNLAAEEDPFALFRLPNNTGSMHHIKKGDNEFIHIKGQDIRDYKVTESREGVSLKVKGHRITGGRDLSSESRYLGSISSFVSDAGTNIDLDLNANTGFKIYERKSGLVLAMGPGYKEISEDMLDILEREVGLSSRIDRELDAIIDDKLYGVTDDLDIDSIISELKAVEMPSEGDEIDRELDRILAEARADLYRYETVMVKDDLTKPAVIEDIRLSRIGELLKLNIRTSRKVGYEIISMGENRRIVLDFPNTVPSEKLAKIDTKASEGLIESIEYKKIEGPYPSSRVIAELIERNVPEFVQTTNMVMVDFELGDYLDREIRRILAEVRAEHRAALARLKDAAEEREFVCVDAQDYLGIPASFTGRRMSLEVYQASVVDVLRMIQRVSNISMVVSDNISGEINVSLSNVPWDQALSVVLQNSGLGCMRQGSVMRVSKLEDLVHERKMARKALEAHRDLEPLKIMVGRYTMPDPSDIKRNLSVLLSSRGRISVDKKTKTVVVHDIEDIVDKASRLLTLMDNKSRVVKM